MWSYSSWNKGKKNLCRKLEWAIAHFHFVLGHDTTDCVVTQLGWAHNKGVATWPRYGQEALRHDQPVRRHSCRRQHDRTQPATRLDGATTRRPVRAATRRCAPGLGAVCMQPGFRVCTLCTRPSFDSVHCFESLFRSLFINTVHGGFSKIKNK